MGGKQSKDSASQSRALFSIRSASLDSISTSVSQRTLGSAGSALPHSPSLDAISQKHTETSGKVTTKDSKGNTYVLLETASITTAETEFPSVAPGEKKEEAERERDDRETSGEKSATQQNGGESVGSKSSRRNGAGSRLTSSLPAGDGEKCAPVPVGSVSGGGGGGVSTQTATELARRKDISRLQNTNKSKLVQRVLPTRSQSSRAAVKPATAVVAPEQRQMEKEVQQLLKSMLKQQQQQQQQQGPETTSTESKDNTPSPPSSAQLPESLLQCSHQELNHLASYICHTIKDTLQSSLVEQALTAQQKKSTTAGREAESTTATSTPSTTKHVQIVEDPVSIRILSGTAEGSESPRTSGGSGAGCGGVGREAEERVQRRRHKRQRRERPVSSPGVSYCDEDPHVHLSDPQTSQSHGVPSGSPHSPPHELQSQTHSNEESYYHRCGGGEQSLDTKTCRACREHSRKFRSPNAADEPLHRAEQRRKRAGRSKNVPVDVSLDDNCPGVNLIRRRYTHRHVVCDNCLQSLGKDGVCRKQGRRLRQKPQSAIVSETPCGNELKLSSGDDRHEVQGVGEGSGFITLYQLRTVAQILQESAGCSVDDNIQQYDRGHQRPFGPPKSQSFRHERRQHNQFRAKSKRKSVVFDDCLSVAGSTELERDVVGPSSPDERLSHLKELAYPTKSRSGRDSPATDMAVIDLSVDSPCMRRPLDPRLKEAATLAIHEEGSPNNITHLHHHYHHIIHHGEP